jgi:hypothetical protein
MPYVNLEHGSKQHHHKSDEEKIVKIKKMTRPEWIRKKKLKKAQLRSRRINR